MHLRKNEQRGFKNRVLKIRGFIRSCFLTICYVGLVGSLSSCKPALLDPKGIIAAEEKHILLISALLMLIVAVPVITLTLAFAWRYRKGNIHAKYSPQWAHSTLLEVICWSVPCIIITILAAITWTTTHTLDPYKPLDVKNQKPLIIQAIALEWKWLFIYPEQHIATVNFVEIPMGVPVRFLITAKGPMNSLQIPQLAGQIYAMAGMQTKLNLLATAPGDYRGFSANYSGRGFSDMKFTVRVGSEEQFTQWVKKVKQSPEILSAKAYSQLTRQSIGDAPRYFSSADQNIFSTTIMKSMMPEKDVATLCKR